MKIYVLFLMTVIGLLSLDSHAQRGVRIGYIDTEYILEHIPEYQEATVQLNDKVERWKADIDLKLKDVAQKRKDLSNEKVLLTSELYEERKEDIDFEEKEILDHQQKRFGPNGDLMLQKKQLIQPIQDQIFSAVQDIAAGKQYDFIFDKSADLVMLYSAERYDISELVLRTINRTSKRQQAQTKAERRAAADEDLVPEYNPELEAREKAQADKILEREALEAQRRQEILDERAANKQAALDRRQKILDDREAAKQEKLEARNKGIENSENIDTLAPSEEKVENSNATAPTEYDLDTNSKSDDTPKTKEELDEERKQQKIRDREAREQELEERKQRILEEREKARQEREALENSSSNTDNN
ncbi:outer membrane family H protein [Formosa agariphila KMM 3901]|uniref:Outer membrane family H protein n=1 Tax=Formosa agariphila (strain DSM 15362 / KCTC 12365 / LMG 23005 / KMM 3901 / M-2Alg 35-1) TaxID=1347342 RepID=T2KJ18_FORAG|nr:OmpH family outer membrane protein [Formosa agariphila]CDF77984.1 outer membrane family H protein [Formosa agariphila KMM 3901]